jgi:phage regulator Rha-like protein
LGSTIGFGEYFGGNVVDFGFKSSIMEVIQSIQNRIYEIRGDRVMLDFDLAEMYGVEARVLNQAVKRNIERFPSDFMFQVTRKEWQGIINQVVRNQSIIASSSQIVTIDLPKNRTDKYLPYAFTEQGIAMLSGILRSERAIQMNIAIMRAFVAIRKIVLVQTDMKEQLKMIKERIEEHDVQLAQIYDAIENILDEGASRKKWEDRERIGFKK